MTQAEVNAYQARRMRQDKTDASEFAASEVESDLHDQIIAECRRRGWIALHGSMASPTKRTDGEPDFVILGARIKLCATEVSGLYEDMRSIVLFIEAKTRQGKLSPAQQAFHAHARKLGHVVHVIRSFQEFLKLL